MKDRSFPYNNCVVDSARGLANANILYTNTTSPNQTNAYAGISSFNTNGFTLRSDQDGYGTNYGGNVSPENYTSWAFRQQDKFFKVVTWTGNGATPRTITHNLGSVPGCIIVKKTSGSEDWFVFHRSMGNNGTFQYFCILNSAAAQDTGGYGMEKASSWTSTTFSLVSGGGSSLNQSGQTYVAYVFAHNAGGFGLTGTDNVSSCGSYTGNGSSTGPVVSLGYEPQWLLIKNATDGATNWTLIDNMRGLPVGSAAARLHPNLSDAEYNNITVASPLPTGFQITNTNSFCNTNGSTYIYIAIRRGPMKTPTSGTSVYATDTLGGTGINPNFRAPFPIDLGITRPVNTSNYWLWGDRLRGGGTTAFQALYSNTTDAEASNNDLGSGQFDYMNGWISNNAGTASNWRSWMFRRAPGFMDEVCYTGTGASSQTYNHNLGVAPELMIVKCRNTSPTDWAVYNSTIGATNYLWLNTTDQSQAFSTIWNNTAPTSSVFTVGSNGQTGASGRTYVAYLFASCPGVSKVGSYTGNGSTQTINCGFTGGARFVLIKRTDSTGDWYVYDTARGMTTLTDPYLLLNSTAAESATLGSVTSVTGGFALNASILAAINTNAASYIFLAIA